MPAVASQVDFSRWLEEFANEAQERGISRSVIDTSLHGVQPMPDVIELDRNQPEAIDDLCRYLGRRLTSSRIERGRRLLKEHRNLLQRVTQKYGVPSRYLIALWGLETNFGDITGSFPVIGALATLAHDERRGPFFREQLFAALRIVDQGHRVPGDMTGSWAGGMGQVQLMPTTFLDNAVDYDGDGRKNIWTSMPDAFASAATYLKRSGWRRGETRSSFRVASSAMHFSFIRIFTPSCAGIGRPSLRFRSERSLMKFRDPRRFARAVASH
jgi:membrane-bound lytic murein transglycosylase B